ncbi:MAG: 4Fe-4S binding protein, partial [Rickettsiales bacterium]|nr:4Fe-4S binding protein [Rickettsiales bacterium]
LINFKICSNNSPCNAIPICPTEAVTWDDINKTLKIDNEKCISCGACAKSCPPMAIRIAKSKQEYDKIQSEYEADPRKIEDLQVDRYGAGAVETPNLKPDEVADFIATNKGLLALEFQVDYYDMPCQILSIPISEIMDLDKITYRAVNNGKEIMKQYGVEELPALVFFENEKQIGKVEGYFSQEINGNSGEKQFLISQVKKIIG